MWYVPIWAFLRVRKGGGYSSGSAGSAGSAGVIAGREVSGAGGIAGSPSGNLREARREGSTRARGGWLCMPLTATTSEPNMWILALQLVFLEVQRQMTLSRNLDSSQNGNVFTIMITLPRRDLRNCIPADTVSR